MKWTTSLNIKVPCPWLIRRFIDPGAEFLFAVSAVGSRQSLRISIERCSAAEARADRAGGRCKGTRIGCSGGPWSARNLTRVAALHARDEDRLAGLFPVYDALYAYVQSIR